MTAVASALPSVEAEPLTFEINTLGATVYPRPELVRFNDDTVPATETIAVAQHQQNYPAHKFVQSFDMHFLHLH